MSHRWDCPVHARAVVAENHRTLEYISESTIRRWAGTALCMKTATSHFRQRSRSRAATRESNVKRLAMRTRAGMHVVGLRAAQAHRRNL